MIDADLVGGARALRDWLKENDTVTFVVKGGALPTGALTAAEIKALAALPTREELLATFMAQLRSPLVKFATLLNAPLRDFANAIKALESKKSSS
jgi:large subunit ribosomal protein L10